MDNLLNSLPPSLDTIHGRAWLTVGTRAGGWQAAYMFDDGFIMKGFHAMADTLPTTVTKLKEQIDLLKLLEAPSGGSESVSGTQ